MYTGRDRAMLITREQEAALGDQMLQAIPLEKALKDTDPRVIAVTAIARRLAAAAVTLADEGPGGASKAPGEESAHKTAPDPTRWKIFVIDEVRLFG